MAAASHWTITIIPNGDCRVREDVLFADRINQTGTYRFVLYLLALRGPGGLALIDTGPRRWRALTRARRPISPAAFARRPTSARRPRWRATASTPTKSICCC